MSYLLPGGSPRVGFWRALLSGPDNRSPAIGRVLGAVIGLLLVLDLLIGLPSLIAGVFLLRGVKPEVWFGLLAALTPYVTALALAIGGLVGGLIAGTAFTEPKGVSTATSATVVSEGAVVTKDQTNG